MSVDYLSTLNKNGSGLNITQIVDSIVQAEVEPKRASITKKTSDIEAQVSELATFKSNISIFQEALNNLKLRDVFQVSTTVGSAVTYSPNSNISAANAFSANVNVTQLAQAQTLEYTGYTSRTQVLSDISLSISFGSVADNSFTADTNRSAVTVSLTAPTLEELAAELTSKSGVTAEIVQTDTGEYSLAIYSDTGASNALSISGDATINTNNYSTVQKLAAQNSKIQINGIEIERQTNEVDGVLAGGSLSLNAVTASAINLSGKYSHTEAESKILKFVDSFNELNTYLTGTTSRSGSAGSGVFATEAAIKSVQSTLNSILRAPLKGFSSDDVNLSEMGITTNKDGSITLNKTNFKTFFEANSKNVMSLGENSFTSEDVNLSVSVSDTASQKSGTFAFAYNSGTSTATLDGNTLSASVSGTTTTFTSSAPGFETLSIKVETLNIPSSTTVSIGVSTKDTFSRLISELLSSTGTIKNKEKEYDNSLADYSDQLTELTVREESVRDRYLAQFTEMERTVTSLKSTGEYITAILNAWNDQNK